MFLTQRLISEIFKNLIQKSLFVEGTRAMPISGLTYKNHPYTTLYSALECSKPFGLRECVIFYIIHLFPNQSAVLGFLCLSELNSGMDAESFI